MTIASYARRGGIAGFNISVRVDSADLDAADARQLNEMIDDANFFALPSEMRRPRDRAARQGGTVPDDIHHEITIEREGRKHSVQVDDQQLPDALEPLVDYLYEAALQQRDRK